MDEWKTLIATITGIITAGGVAIKIWGNKGAPKIEEINEEIDRKTGEFESNTKELTRRINEIERSFDKIEGSVANVNDKLSAIDEKSRDEFRAVWDEISGMSSSVTLSLKEITANVSWIKGVLSEKGSINNVG